MPKQNYVDLYHLMDRSGSVKPAGFNNAKLAAKVSILFEFMTIQIFSLISCPDTWAYFI